MVEAWLTGLRISAIVLWFTLGVRVAFYSWHITEQDRNVRARGWFHFRLALFIMAVAVVCFFSPADILRVNGYISQNQREYMALCGVALIVWSGIQKLVALDISTGQNKRVWPAYVATVLLSLLYVVAAR